MRSRDRQAAGAFGSGVVYSNQSMISLGTSGVYFSPSSEFSSRGQIRTIALALKLGEANALKNNINNSPIIALDDILSELDEVRRGTVMDYIDNYDQVILTAPDEKLLVKNPKFNGKIFFVKNGEIIDK